MIKSFIKNFTTDKLEFRRIKNTPFLIQSELWGVVDNIPLHPFSAGMPLGMTKNDKFHPSFFLLEWLSERSEKKIMVDSEKIEWLFLCGRDLFKDNVNFDRSLSGLCLVQGPNDENLGYGLISNHKKEIKNLFDRGDFLRRER